MAAIQKQQLLLGLTLLQQIDQPPKAQAGRGDAFQVEVLRRQVHRALVILIGVAGEVEDKLIVGLDLLEHVGNALREADLAHVD